MKQYYVYIIGNWTGDVLYTGMTNDLSRRLFEHKQKTLSGFTKNYNVNKLLYHEIYERVEDAIQREKQLKNWRREKKVQLIEELNQEWKDLSESWG